MKFNESWVITEWYFYLKKVITLGEDEEEEEEVT